MCKLLFNLSKDRLGQNQFNIVEETGTRQSSLCNEVACQSMKPVSRKRTSYVGSGRFNPTIPPNQEKTKEDSKSNITVHNTLCVVLEMTSTHEPSS